MLPPPIVKQPHYVWRLHLEAWEVNGRLHVARNGGRFATVARKVAKEGGFHDLHDLSEDDIQFVIQTIVRPGSPLEQQHLQFIARIVSMQQVSKTFSDADTHTAEEVAWANKFLRDTEEELQTKVENLGEPWLRALRNADCSFLEHPKSNLFFYYIAMQYVRTKALARRIISAEDFEIAELTAQRERTWPLMRQLHAIDIAADLSRTRQAYALIFLDNESEVDFVTGDQPIIDTRPITGTKLLPDGFELYYPLTPRRAMLWTPSARGKTGARVRINDAVVEHYNRLMVKASLEMVFATSMEALEPYYV